MHTTQHTFRLTAISAILVTVFGSAFADDAEVNKLTKPDSTISVGLGSWSGERHQQGIYDGMRDNGLFGLLNADVIKRDDATGIWLTFKALNLGLETREFRGDYLRQGSVGGFFEYGKTTRDNPFTINTGLQGIGSTTLTTGTNRSSFTKTNVDLGTSRELLHVGGFTNLMPGLDAKIDFRNEDKTGTRQWGWGSAALFSVEPIDSNTQQLEAVLQYSGKKLQLSGGYLGSWYTNHNLQVQENLNGMSGGTSSSFNAYTPMSLPLSNQANQVFLDGGYNFTQATRGNFKVAFTRATQDEHLPSYDLTGANAPYAYAPSHLDGLINTTLAQLGVSSRTTSKLTLTSSVRYYDVNDKTPLAGYVGTNATGVASVYNTPHSYTTKSGNVEATYRLPDNYNVTAGVDYANQDRSYPTVGTVYVPFRAETTEMTYRVQLRRALSENLNGSIAYLHSERDGSSYTDANGSVPYTNQVNPIQIADRNRDKWRTSFDWEPVEKLSLQFRVDLSQDRYPENGRPYGAKDGNAQLYALDGTYIFSDDWQFSAWYSRDNTQARMAGFRQSGTGAANAIKDARIEDRGDSVGMSLRGKLTSKIEGGLGLDWFRNVSKYPQELDLTGAGASYPTGVVGPVPDIRSSMLRLKLDARYALDKQSDFRFDVIYERWHTDDWTWNSADGSPYGYYSGTLACAGCTGAGYTGVVDGTTVTSKQTQISTFVGVRYIYKFQ